MLAFDLVYAHGDFRCEGCVSRPSRKRQKSLERFSSAGDRVGATLPSMDSAPSILKLESFLTSPKAIYQNDVTPRPSTLGLHGAARELSIVLTQSTAGVDGAPHIRASRVVAQ